MCPVFRSHNSVLFFFLVHDSSLDLCTSDANEAYSATGTAYSSEAFYGSCWQIFSFLCSVCGQLSVFWPLYCLFFGHCIVCLLAIVLSVIWPLYCLSFGHCIVCLLTILFSVFWPLYWLSFFVLWLLITPLLSWIVE